MIKCMLQSSRLEYRMKTIGIDQSLFTMSSFEHKCFKNIQKIYQHAGKCDNQENIKDILDATMVSTPDGVTDDTTTMPITSTSVKKRSARKSLCLFINILNVKKNTSKRRIGAAKSKRRAMKVVTRLGREKKGS